MTATYGGAMMGSFPARRGYGYYGQGLGAPAASAGGGLTVASGAATGAAVGSIVPGVGTAVGGAVGAAAGLVSQFTGSGGAKTQQHGRYSVTGHEAVMTALIHAQRWDDADAETRAWFGAGLGTPDERQRFKPNGPPHLASGKLNYSLVARYGHQAAAVAGAAVQLPDGSAIQFAGTQPLGQPGAIQAGFFGGGGNVTTIFVIVGITAAILYNVSEGRKRTRRAA